MRKVFKSIAVSAGLLFSASGFANGFTYEFAEGRLTTFSEITEAQAAQIMIDFTTKYQPFHAVLNNPKSTGNCIVVCMDHRGYMWGKPLTKTGVSEYDAHVIAEEHEYNTDHRNTAVWCGPEY